MHHLGLLLSFLLYHFNGVVVADGMFPYVCECPKDHQPVCGSDGETYFNECFLKCRKDLDREALYHAHNGRCEDDWLSVKDESDIGKLDFGLLLSFLLYHFKGAISVDGMFPYVCVCPRNNQPICGSDGETYYNECFLACRKSLDKEALYHAHNGRCEDDWLTVKGESDFGKDSHLCGCPKERIPVCGSDGRTYPNLCLLNCRRKVTLEALYFVHYGNCEDNMKNQPAREEAPCLCPAMVRPVCGSDGNTYVNECQLRCRREQMTNLRKINDGVCERRKIVGD